MLGLIAALVYLGIGYGMFKVIIRGQREVIMEQIKEIRPDLATERTYSQVVALLAVTIVLGWPIFLAVGVSTVIYDMAKG